MKKKYLVIENTPGYSPESDPIEFTNKKAAQRYATELAKEYKQGYKVYGNRNKGYYAEKDCCHDLGRVIKIIEVYD